MKKFVLLLMLLLLSGTTAPIQAQLSSVMEKTYLKNARKEAKKMAKEGWQILPGALPLENQLFKAYVMQEEKTAYDVPKYFWGSGTSTGQNIDAAKMQAIEMAIQDLAATIHKEVTIEVDNTTANEQLPQDQAASVTKSVRSSRSFVEQSIGRTTPIVEAIKYLPNGNKVMLINLFCDAGSVMAKAIQKIREKLEQEGELMKGSKGYEALEEIERRYNNK